MPFLCAECCSCCNEQQSQSWGGGALETRWLLLSPYCRESAFFFIRKKWSYVVSWFQNTNLQQIRLDDDTSVNGMIRWKIHYSSSSGIFIGINFRQYKSMKDLKLFQNKIKRGLFPIKLKWYVRLHNRHSPSILNSNGAPPLLSLSVGFEQSGVI